MQKRSLGERYLDHYERFFRSEPTAAAMFPDEASGSSIQILTFDGVFKGCRLFATLGATHFQRELGGAWEVVCCVDACFESVPALLANAVLFAASKHRSLGERRAIGSLEQLDPDFVRTTGKSALYFSGVHSLPPEFVELTDTPGARMRGAIFISAAEAELNEREGWERFEERLEAADVDPFDVRRPSAV